MSFACLALAGTCTAPGQQAYTATVLQSTGFYQTNASAISGNLIIGIGQGWGGVIRAILWRVDTGQWLDVSPPGYSEVEGCGIEGTTMVGDAIVGGQWHAVLWSLNTPRVVDLNPGGFTQSIAFGVSGGTQIGVGYLPGSFRGHALLWHGSAASAVDLGPMTSTIPDVFGEAVSGDAQVGIRRNPNRAVLWHGTAASAIDLTPATCSIAGAFGVSGDVQVGFGLDRQAGQDHALLWHGTAASAIDLNPSWCGSSSAEAASDGVQVGYGRDLSGDDYDIAVLWNGTAISAVNLQTPLAAMRPELVQSEAVGVSEGVAVGWGQDFSGHPYAVMWKPSP